MENIKKGEYPFAEIEKKWQDKWDKTGVFKAKNNSDKKKYYVLSMFPYPSGALHMGHVSNYSISDAIARLRFTEGYNVLQPQGFDAFGMPAENFAILNNSHPSITTEANIQIMLNQFKILGVAVDWDRELSTHRPDYYRWGQWLFKRMYERGLVYRKSSFVNWCDECQTVLANEQVEEGKCWRCDTVVRQKDLIQWFFKITAYAEELLDFSKVIDWPERVKTMQMNWIGKSIGTEVDFPVEPSCDLVKDRIVKIFTTRPDTLFGVTFMALPPEHPLIVELLNSGFFSDDIIDFCNKVINEDKINRSAADTTKEGVFTGLYCINPVNGDKVQIWITNYVLMEYGTGAVMAVPAHDQRDFEFAKKYSIPIKIVIQNKEKNLVVEDMKQAYTDVGILVNSADFNDMDSDSSKEIITKWLDKNGYGRSTTTYRLRDWGISRQRYWGTPIPVIHCDNCGIVLVPDDELPVKLPMNVQVGKTTNNPLLSVEDWVNVSCPQCNKPAKRETDTMDTFVDSSWYYAKYTDVTNNDLPFNENIANYWLPVDQYIGGIEHACMHLLYARFFHKFMRDISMVKSDEPFARLLTQGMVLNEGAKMSKSKGNTVNPQEFIDRYGADTCRLFVLFASPPEKDVEWSQDGVVGAFRFLNRLWHFYSNFCNSKVLRTTKPALDDQEISSVIKELRYSTHYTIKKNLDDLSSKMQFNTNIASIMEHFNNLNAIKKPEDLSELEQYYYSEAAMAIPRLLYFYAPHLSEEIWAMLGGEGFIHQLGLIDFNPSYLVLDQIVYVVQVNGKIRGKLEINAEADDEEIKKAALDIENVKKSIEGNNIKKIIVVRGKLVSIVM